MAKKTKVQELAEENRLLAEQNSLLKERKGLTEQQLDVAREDVNLVKDLSKQITYQTRERRDLLNISNELYKIEEKSYTTSIQEQLTSKGTTGLKKEQLTVLKGILKLESLVGKIKVENEETEKEINDSIKSRIKSAKTLLDVLKEQLELVEGINENAAVKGFGLAEDITQAVPGLRKFTELFTEARSKASEYLLDERKKATTIEKVGSGRGTWYRDVTTGKRTSKEAFKKQQDNLAKGLSGNIGKAIMQGLSGALGKLLGRAGVIGIIYTTLKFIVDLFVGADKLTTDIAKNLGISKDNAEIFRKDFVDIAGNSKNILVTSNSLAEAQKDLVGYSKTSLQYSDAALENQVFLTKNLGISADGAAKTNFMFEAMGKNAMLATDAVIDQVNSAAKQNGYLISSNVVLSDIAATSEDILGYYGFSEQKLAQAVLTARKYGLTLEQTQKVANSLLDFESSISAELEAELLTGKQLNFEKARALALTGDMAGAAEAVLNQMEGLTEAQRRNPLIMQAYAKASGLSAQELNRAYLIHRKLNMTAEEYHKMEDRANKLGIELQGATREEMEKTLAASEKWQATLDKLKDQLSGLLDSGVIDDLADALISAANWFSGLDEEARQRMKDREEAKRKDPKAFENGMTDQEYRRAEKAAQGPGVWDWLVNFGMGGYGYARLAQQYTEQAQAKKLIAAEQDRVKSVEDFTIRTHPKDTLVMAGGTQLGSGTEETNELLKELIAAVNKGGNVYMDSYKVGEANMIGRSAMA